MTNRPVSNFKYSQYKKFTTMKSSQSTALNEQQCIKRHNAYASTGQYINTFFMLVLSLVIFFSCDKEEELQPFEFKTTTMEHTLSGVEFTLENAEEQFVIMKWAPVDFGASKTVKY